LSAPYFCSHGWLDSGEDLSVSWWMRCSGTGPLVALDWRGFGPQRVAATGLLVFPDYLGDLGCVAGGTVGPRRPCVWWGHSIGREYSACLVRPGSIRPERGALRRQPGRIRTCGALLPAQGAGRECANGWDQLKAEPPAASTTRHSKNWPAIIRFPLTPRFSAAQSRVCGPRPGVNSMAAGRVRLAGDPAPHSGESDTCTSAKIPRRGWA